MIVIVELPTFFEFGEIMFNGIKIEGVRRKGKAGSRLGP